MCCLYMYIVFEQWFQMYLITWSSHCGDNSLFSSILSAIERVCPIATRFYRTQRQEFQTKESNVSIFAAN